MGGKGSGKNREEERLEKIDWILKLVDKKKIKKDALLGLIQMKFGCSRRTGLDYISVLLNCEKIKEVEGLLEIN